MFFIPLKRRDRKKTSAALLCSDLYFPSLITVVPENEQGRLSTSAGKQPGKYSAKTLTLWLLIYHDKLLNLSFQKALAYEAKRECGNVREAMEWLALSTFSHLNSVEIPLSLSSL